MKTVKVIEFPVGSLEWRILSALTLGVLVEVSDVATFCGVTIDRARAAADAVIDALGPDGSICAKVFH